MAAPRISLIAATLLVLGIQGAAPMSSERAHGFRERARLRAHFARVERVLLANDVAALNVAQRAARARQIEALRAYAKAGAFPRNRGECVVATPIFVDQEGNRCAMASLIERSGAGHLVERVARDANLARIHELAADPELIAWLDDSGLSAEEAGLIQPAYGRPDPSADRESGTPGDGVLVASNFLAVLLGGPAIVLNLQEDWPPATRRQHIALGAVTSSSLLAVGVTDWADDGHARGTGYFALTVGAATAVVTVLNALRGRDALASGAHDTGTGGVAAVCRDADRVSQTGNAVSGLEFAGVGVRRSPRGEAMLSMSWRF